MDAFQLAWVAYHGFILLVAFVAAGITAARAPKPPDPAPADIEYIEMAREAPAFCPCELTLLEPGEWMVRR